MRWSKCWLCLYFRKMLNRAGTELKANSKYLCGAWQCGWRRWSRNHYWQNGWCDERKTEDTTIDTMRVLLDGAAAFIVSTAAAWTALGCNGVYRMVSQESWSGWTIQDLEPRKMFAGQRRFYGYFKAKQPGDKTMVDALHPAIDAIAETQGSLKSHGRDKRCGVKQTSTSCQIRSR